MKKILPALFALFFVAIISIGITRTQAQTPDPDPIILVPGILGSWDLSFMLDTGGDVDWNFFYTDKSWNNLIDALENEGLQKDQDYFIAFYDWRKSNRDSAQNYLLPTIDRALAANPEAEKVDVIAHSMGGLVVRAYMQELPRFDIDDFIMLGTPNYGASDAYSLWEGGRVPTNWQAGQRYGLNFYTWYNKVRHFNAPSVSDITRNFLFANPLALNAVLRGDFSLLTGTALIELQDSIPTSYEVIQNQVPSVAELLPTYDYLVDKSTGELIDIEEMAEQNPLLTELNTDASLFNLGNPGILLIVAGDDQPTVNTIPVVPHTAGDGLWVDGKPDPINPVADSNEGDNRVLVSSTFLELPEPGPVPVQAEPIHLFAWLENIIPSVFAQGFFNLNTITLEDTRHGAIPTEAIDDVFEELGLATPAFDYIAPTDPENVLSFWFASPVEVKIIAPNGGMITRDINEIEGAIYDGEDDPAGVKIVIIPEAQEGEYRVELTAIDEGGDYYMAAAHFAGGEESHVNTLGNEVQQGESIGYKVQYNPLEQPEIPTEFIETYIPGEDEEDKTALELLQELLDELHGKPALLVHVKIAKKLLERAEFLTGKESGVFLEQRAEFWRKLAVKQVKKFIKTVEFYERKNWLDSATAAELIEKAEAIIAKLQ